MIIILCPTCYGAKVKRVDDEKWPDYFKCKNCEEFFPLESVSYREEGDLFD